MSDLTNAMINFFEVEIANECSGGIRPATLDSAIDSLSQAPADVVVEWCNDETVSGVETVRDFLAALINLRDREGGNTRLYDLLPGPQD